MKRIGFAAFATALAVSPAGACKSDFLVVEDFGIKETNHRADVTVKYRIAGEKAYRLIDGSFVFTDAFGTRLGSIAVPRADQIGPGDTVSYDGLYMDGGLRMAAKMHPDDVKITSCVRAVVYSDGTQESFE